MRWPAPPPIFRRDPEEMTLIVRDARAAVRRSMALLARPVYPFDSRWQQPCHPPPPSVD